MIRVAWRIHNTPDWIGGLNYFRNLFAAVMGLHNRRIQPVLLGDPEQFPSCFRSAEFVPNLYERNGWRPARILSSVERLILRNGGAMARHLRRHHVRVFSHGEVLGSRSPIPAVGWIPDFQHRHLPEFFSKTEMAIRNSIHALMAKEMQGVIFSSQNALQDFCRFFPQHRCRKFVLNFVAAPAYEELPPVEGVVRKYDIAEPFFLIPNQVWAHKNHSVVLEALKKLDRTGSCPLVINTGQTKDSRNPDYFNALARRVEAAGLSERLRFLGLVDYSHVAVLMRAAICVINPSLFEGWSTVVEEAKTLGKRLLLSDIAVHREQAPERASYFGPHDADALASLMGRVVNDYDGSLETSALQRGTQLLTERLSTFGKAYEDIILSLV